MWTSGAHTLSTRPHLNIKSLTEPGDQRTQPAVSQLPASRLRNAFLLFPESCRGVCQRLSGQTSTEEKMLSGRSPTTTTTAWKFLVPRLTPPGGPPVCGPLSHKGATTSYQFERITENQERGLKIGAQMIQSGNEALQKGLLTFSKEKTNRRLSVFQISVKLLDQMSL